MHMYQSRFFMKLIFAASTLIGSIVAEKFCDLPDAFSDIDEINCKSIKECPSVQFARGAERALSPIIDANGVPAQSADNFYLCKLGLPICSSGFLDYYLLENGSSDGLICESSCIDSTALIVKNSWKAIFTGSVKDTKTLASLVAAKGYEIKNTGRSISHCQSIKYKRMALKISKLNEASKVEEADEVGVASFFEDDTIQFHDLVEDSMNEKSISMISKDNELSLIETEDIINVERKVTDKACNDIIDLSPGETAFCSMPSGKCNADVTANGLSHAAGPRIDPKTHNEFYTNTNTKTHSWGKKLWNGTKKLFGSKTDSYDSQVCAVGLVECMNSFEQKVTSTIKEGWNKFTKIFKSNQSAETSYWTSNDKKNNGYFEHLSDSYFDKADNIFVSGFECEMPCGYTDAFFSSPELKFAFVSQETGTFCPNGKTRVVAKAIPFDNEQKKQDNLEGLIVSLKKDFEKHYKSMFESKGRRTRRIPAPFQDVKKE